MRISDWSSDVLSSDLRDIDDQARRFPMALDRPAQIVAHAALHQQGAEAGSVGRDDHARAAALAPAQPELAILGVTLVLRPPYVDAPAVVRQRTVLDRVGREFRSEEHTSEIQAI